MKVGKFMERWNRKPIVTSINGRQIFGQHILVCPYCQMIVPTETPFCPQCGRKVEFITKAQSVEVRVEL